MVLLTRDKLLVLNISLVKSGLFNEGNMNINTNKMMIKINIIILLCS